MKMYRDEKEFVRGQKIKLLLILGCALVLALYALAAHLAGWNSR